MHDKVISELIGTGTTIESVRSQGKICLVTGELAGPDLNGGIGTTNRALALTLRNAGFDVDVLYTKVNDGAPFSGRGTFAQHVDALRKYGIQLSCIDHIGKWNDWQAKSYFALQHLLRHQYRLALFDDTHGNAYYPLLARRTGNADLRDTIMCVTAHSATQWISDLNQTAISTIEELRLMEMERRSIELADAVKAPSAYILQKYRSYGWAVPENSIVLPNFIPGGRFRKPTSKATPINEIVFFGRLETRKGLWMFCRALDRLKYRFAGKTVTFLGKATIEDNVSTSESLLRYSAAWPFKIRLIDNFDQEQALAYLAIPGRLAVLASPEDNSPSAMLECLAGGIPFIACSGSGGEELLDQESRTANLFEPSVESLCAKLLDTFEHGAVVGRPSFDETKLHDSFSNWINDLLTQERRVRKSRGLLQMRKPTLIVLVPSEVSASEAAAEVLRAVELFGGLIDIELLSWDVLELRLELTKIKSRMPVKVSDVADFARIMLSLATREPSIVALCHITQIPSPSWIERAEICFASDADISALTGMVGSTDERKMREREPFVSRNDDVPVIKQYLTGNARALLPLAQETNSGFAVLRSELLAILAELAPVDNRHDRFKQMADWIHEVLVALHMSGKRFELVPDLVVEQSVREAHFESLDLVRFMRNLASTMFGYSAGSDQALLTQLAIDAGLQSERTLAKAEYLRHMSEKLGHRLSNVSMYDFRHDRQLAAVAHANAQMELAVDLLAKPVMKENSTKDANFGDFVRQEANAVVLTAAIAAKRFKGLNLDKDFLFRYDSSKQEIVLHANSADKGIVALIFPSEDLSKVTRFTSAVAVADASDPIRFRIQLLGADKSRQWSAEKIVNGGQEMVWNVELPANCRAVCRVLIGIEMADADSSSTGAFARWINPRFVPNAQRDSDELSKVI